MGHGSSWIDTSRIMMDAFLARTSQKLRKVSGKKIGSVNQGVHLIFWDPETCQE
jgi:hypothetical protein